MAPTPQACRAKWHALAHLSIHLPQHNRPLTTHVYHHFPPPPTLYGLVFRFGVPELTAAVSNISSLRTKELMSQADARIGGPQSIQASIIRRSFHPYTQNSRLQTAVTYKFPLVSTTSSKNFVHLFFHNAIARSFSSAPSVEY